MTTSAANRSDINNIQNLKENTNVTTATAASLFAAPAPKYHHEPLKITDDTYLIRHLHGENELPMAVYLNSMVILGSEPVIVDTGCVNNRDRWIDDVFGLVDPKDVKWIFISHDDHDHTGNLVEALAMCPNATLVTNWFQMERLAGDIAIPPTRMRWVDDGEAFDAGDRRLFAIRPPVFDSPTTRGLYDSKSKVYWGVDTFATPVMSAIENVAELDREFWAQGFQTFASAVSPWHTMVDPAKYNKVIDRIADLDMVALCNAHAPITSGQRISEGIAMLRQLPFQSEAKLPGQADLEAMLVAMGIAA